MKASRQTLEALLRLEKIILDTLDFTQLVQKICDSVLSELYFLDLSYRLVVLTLLDEANQSLGRVSLSHTPEAEKINQQAQIPFKKITIPLEARDNLCIKAFLQQKAFTTQDWSQVFNPPLSSDNALNAQKSIGILSTVICPIVAKGKSVGVLVFSVAKPEEMIMPEEKDLMSGFTDIVGVAVENAQLYTNLDQARRQLQSANQKLKELDKLKDEFVSVASHELRTPMSTIKSYLWMVLNGKAGPLNDKIKQYLTHAYQSTERLTGLVNDMLDVSRIESGRIELAITSVDLAALAEEVRQELLPAVQQKGLQLELINQPQPPPVAADKNKIHQVLTNLVGNALKFTDAGGRITIQFKASGQFVETSVTDTGKGISPENQQKLFQKFGRLEKPLDGQQKGTGLGLYICHQLIKLHGGNIGVRSQLGQGSTFIFSLPLASKK